ncbi:hypothetical protein Tsubulata_024965 [Turnera subulata]|uniref:RRM domain-containing protein n=1 Tax=Turnera subulata TaxID=218843 RepID=A0A9Q0JFZ1_9ROSI|nr:hypothetical protein Tsubulata_024965 [Turnera subulata]
MAATAAAAVGSSFSPSIPTTLKCAHPKFPSNSLALKQLIITHPPPSARITLSSSSAWLSTHAIEPLSLGAVTPWRLVPRMSTDVAQAETTDTVADADAPAAVEEEEKEEDQVSSEGEGETQVGGEDGQEGGEAGGEGSVSTKLYFGNLPYNVDSAQLAGMIQEYATPELVEILYHRETGRSRGYGFVTMSTIEDCNKVIENLDGSEFLGRALRVNLADKPRPKLPLYPDTEHKLFIGNLSWSATSESLTKLFQECGNVVGARVLYDGETGRSKGYGFVSYSTGEEMENALETLNGAELEGREIRVSVAEGRRS